MNAPEGPPNHPGTVAQSPADRERILAQAEARSGPCSEPMPLVTVAGYELIGILGAGGCGVVYKARHERFNRLVAVKTVLVPPDRASHAFLGQFRLEAVSLARLWHPNIVAVFDSGMCEFPPGQPYFAMELLDGEDLDRRLRRDGPLPEPVAWLIARQAASALAHAAEHGIIHRDVKPANLFLVTPPTGFPLPEGVPMVKVTDFGIALCRTRSDLRLPLAGSMLGTPLYMPPEQFETSNVDVRADIYALGCTIYYALAGKPPFLGEDLLAQKSASPPRLASTVSPETADLVAAMLAVSPTGRPQDYADLLARLDALPCLRRYFG